MDYRTRLAYAEQDLLTQSALIRDLVEGLERYGVHLTSCQSHYREVGMPSLATNCDCGLSALIKRGREGK